MKEHTLPDSLPIRRIPLRDIAKRAGVSISTVSRVLNNAYGISDELRRQVIDVATEMGYYDSIAPTRLRHIGLFTATFSDSPGLGLDNFHTAILHGIEAECRQHDIQLSYSIVEQGEQGSAFISRKIKERQIEGVLLASIQEREVIEQLLGLNMPMAVINADHRELLVDTFLPANFTGALLATQHLLAHGHQRILHITTPTYTSRRTLHQRFDGYRTAMQEVGIPFDPRLVLESHLRVDLVRDAVYDLLMANKCQFTAVFAVNDEAAIGAMHAIQEAGKRVPEDISVIGFDDIPTSALLTPALTSMHIDCIEMGVLAARRLMDRFQHPNATPICVELACKLKSRQSVGTLPTSG